MKNLVIVESPAKAKTIGGFLGENYLVKSCYGHVRDLPKANLGVDIEKNFHPIYEVQADKKAVISELKKISGKVDMVWLATDEDREGEAISWHLAESLGLSDNRYRRIAFHEITRKAIENAISNPRSIDMDLVNAQQARRVLDRIVGFELSPVLWKKVKPSLSAGRVQSVAVRLIVEREKEIQQFKTLAAFKVAAIFDVPHMGATHRIKAELPGKFDTKQEAKSFLSLCNGALFTVQKSEVKPAKKSPAPPFTTSTLQQEASRKLGFSVARTMTVAQRLYESGKITYMRTDSVNLSDTAIHLAKEEINRLYGSKYSKTRQFATKTKGAQEAHEAIRPVYLNTHEASDDPSEQKLYELIWKRTIASQMADASIERTQVTIGISSHPEKFVAIGEVLLFDGFLKVYLESSDEDEEATGEILPPMKVGQELHMQEITATERFSKHPARYTEASLVKKLEELGIGRPSTYAPIINTIQKRDYVLKDNRPGEKRDYDYLVLKNKKITETTKSENIGQEKNKLFPTDIGVVVTTFLLEHFPPIMDYHFTASVEKEFDEIAAGKKLWNKVLHEFYEPFHAQIVQTLTHTEKFSGERLLGTDPQTGKNMYARLGRFGPMVQIGDAEDSEKPRFASLKKDQSLDTITIDQALDLFKLPRMVGLILEKEVVASTGRFGPYLRFEEKFYSIPRTEDPLTITLERAKEIIAEKQEKDKNKIIKEFESDPKIKILMGRWGAYLWAEGENYKLPKTQKPEDFSLEDCINIIKGGTSTKKSRTTKVKTSRKKG